MRQPKRFSRTSGPAVELETGFSLSVLCCLGFLYGLAAVVVLNLSGPGWPAVILLSLVAASLAAAMPLSGLAFSGRSLLRASWHADASWTLCDRHGRAQAARLRSHVACTDGLLLLSWDRAGGRRVSAVFVRNRENADDFRRLRARLRSDYVA